MQKDRLSRDRTVSSVRRAAEREIVDMDDEDWDTRGHCPKRGSWGAWWDRAMPGHGVISRFGDVSDGGARGWHHRAKVSMTTMSPPQYGHGGRVSSGSAGMSS